MIVDNKRWHNCQAAKNACTSFDSKTERDQMLIRNDENFISLHFWKVRPICDNAQLIANSLSFRQLDRIFRNILMTWVFGLNNQWHSRCEDLTISGKLNAEYLPSQQLIRKVRYVNYFTFRFGYVKIGQVLIYSLAWGGMIWPLIIRRKLLFIVSNKIWLTGMKIILICNIATLS